MGNWAVCERRLRRSKGLAIDSVPTLAHWGANGAFSIAIVQKPHTASKHLRHWAYGIHALCIHNSHRMLESEAKPHEKKKIQTQKSISPALSTVTRLLTLWTAWHEELAKMAWRVPVLAPKTTGPSHWILLPWRVSSQATGAVKRTQLEFLLFRYRREDGQ